MAGTGKKDYYKILGITDEEKNLPWKDFEKVVKKKYRKLSMEWHPDRHQESDEEKKKAEERFKEIAEAYTVLSDQSKKQDYDNSGSSFAFNGFEFDPFNMMHGFNPFNFKRTSKKYEKKQSVGGTIRIAMPLSLEEMYNGVEKTIKYKRQEPCDKCNGTGGTAQDCPVCGGTGMEYRNLGGFHQMSTCMNCKGKGRTLSSVCDACNGSGFKVVDHEVTITIPKGVHGGMNLEIQGEGSLPLSSDGVPGNLIVALTEKEDNRFVRRGNDLLFEIKVPLITAILGGKMNVETIDGKKLVADIPSGSEEGKTIRFANKGMPIYNSEGKFGHMLGVVKIDMPKELNAEEKRLLKKLSEQEHFKA